MGCKCCFGMIGWPGTCWLGSGQRKLTHVHGSVGAEIIPTNQRGNIGSESWWLGIFSSRGSDYRMQSWNCLWWKREGDTEWSYIRYIDGAGDHLAIYKEMWEWFNEISGVTVPFEEL